MQSFSVRFFLHAAGAIALAALAPLASAQVTLNLTTTQQTNCTATTDAQGLRLVPGGTDLSATGVTLSGDGCGSGPATSDFQAAIQVPGTATVGTPFAVTWSAGAAATQCTYGGTAGMAGWPVGTTACQGTNCNSNHTASVTATTAGAYSLSVTCTNTSGYATGGGSASGAPTAPVFTTALALNPTSITVGQNFAATWAVSGATSCQGSAELDGNPVTLTGWTNVSPTASPVTLTPAQAGTYSLKLTCTNAVGSTTSGPAAVVVQSSTDSCPTGQQTTADVCYSNYGTSCTSMNITAWDNVFGHLAGGDALVPFPGVQSYSMFKNWDKTKYIALKFTVPATGLPTNQWGIVSHGETNPGPIHVDMAISASCGDFNPATSICKTTSVNPGAVGAKWKLPTATQTNGCQVVAGQSYYLNIRATNPAAAETGSTCTGNICRASFNNNHTP